MRSFAASSWWSTTPEWFGIDLETGAFIRVLGTGPLAEPTEPPFFGSSLSPSQERSPRSIPPHPELVVAEPVVDNLGDVPRKAPETPLLARRSGRPSWCDRAQHTRSLGRVRRSRRLPASVTMLNARRSRLELLVDRGIALPAITFGGVTQRFPVLDGRAIDIGDAGRNRDRSQGRRSRRSWDSGSVTWSSASATSRAATSRKDVYALLPRTRG